MDTAEPTWKYLSGFAIKKETANKDSTGTLTNLLTPRRGATKVTSGAGPPQITDDLPPDQPGDEPIMDPPFNATGDDAAPPPPDDAVPPQTQVIQQNAGAPMPMARQTRSRRTIRNTPRYEQSIAQRDQGLVAWEVLLDQDDREQVPTVASQYKNQKSLENPLAFAASDNPDILYWDQAMKAPDRAKFVDAVGTELDGHEKMGNYEPVPLSAVPKNTKLIDMVWSMRRKWRIKTQEVYKWKAHLNVHGGQQEHGVHYWDTYAPVVTWQTIPFFLILSILLKWQSRQLDFVMAYPQAPTEMPLYMRLPQGYKCNGITRKTHALKLLRNVYGQKQATRVWNKFMDQGMHEIRFTPSQFDPCLYYRGSVVFLVYIDDCIIFAPSDKAIDQVVKDLRDYSRRFTVDDQGDVGDFLGIQVQKQDDGSILLTQPQLIASIIQYLHLQASSNSKKTPSTTTSLLHKDSDGPEMTPDFHYRSVIGKLNFLEKSTCPNISISVHQCARFSENPRKSYAEAVKRLGRYLLHTRDKGLIIRPSNLWQFDCWVDADFAGNWRKCDAHVDPMTSKSRSGWLVCFAGAPISWASKMQTITAMSTTEAEYIALSTSLREVIPMMGMLQDGKGAWTHDGLSASKSALHGI